jgi:hypothetical protein
MPQAHFPQELNDIAHIITGMAMRLGAAFMLLRWAQQSSAEDSGCGRQT